MMSVCYTVINLFIYKLLCQHRLLLNDKTGETFLKRTDCKRLVNVNELEKRVFAAPSNNYIVCYGWYNIWTSFGLPTKAL